MSHPLRAAGDEFPAEAQNGPENSDPQVERLLWRWCNSVLLVAHIKCYLCPVQSLY